MCVFNTVAKVRKEFTTQSPPVIAYVILSKSQNLYYAFYKVLHGCGLHSPPWPDLPLVFLFTLLQSCWPWCKPFVLTRLAPPRRALLSFCLECIPTEPAWIPSPHVLQVFFPKLTFSVTCFWHRFEFPPSYFAMSYALSCFFFFSFYNYCSLTYNIYYLDILFIDWIPQ